MTYNVGIAQPTLVGAQASATPSSATPIPVPAGANGVILGAFTANVIYTLDGSTPDADDGFIVEFGKAPQWVRIPTNCANVTVFSGTGKLIYQFYKD